ncbi:MAG: hypothetical protein V3W04_08435 [Gammaproteobacteria bacterium]
MHRIYNILTGKWEATLQANDSRNRHEISMMNPVTELQLQLLEEDTEHVETHLSVINMALHKLTPGCQK